MRYVQAAPFINVMNNEVLKIENTTPEQVLRQDQVSKEAQVSDILALVCGAYVPSPGEVLTIHQVRRFHSIMDIIEGTYTINDWMAFGEEEIAILIQLISWTLPRMAPVLLRNADNLLSLLESSPTKDPRPAEAPVANS